MSRSAIVAPSDGNQSCLIEAIFSKFRHRPPQIRKCVSGVTITEGLSSLLSLHFSISQQSRQSGAWGPRYRFSGVQTRDEIVTVTGHTNDSPCSAVLISESSELFGKTTSEIESTQFIVKKQFYCIISIVQATRNTE